MLPPRLRPGLTLARRPPDTIVFTPEPRSFSAIPDDGGAWHDLLELADGTRDAPALALAMRERGHDLSEGDIESGVEQLAAAGLTLAGRADASPAASQIAYFELRADAATAQAMQRRVASAHVVVLGAGGVGSWLSMAFALMGVRAVTVVDPDRVELGNLTRQPYPPAAIGERKIEALGDLLRALRPTLRYAGVDAMIDDPADLADLLDGADLVCCCADHPTPAAMAELVASVCVPRRLPHLNAAYHGPVVRLGPVWTPRRRRVACAGCLAAARAPGPSPYGPTEAEVRRSRARGATTAITVSQSMLAASLAAEEGLQALAGSRPSATNRVLTIDQRAFRAYRSRVAPHEECRVCASPARSSPVLPRQPSRREGVIR